MGPPLLGTLLTRYPGVMNRTWTALKGSPRLIAILSLVVVSISCFLLLRLYTVEMIHIVVVQALIQKAPPTYPSQDIHDAFDGARRAAADADDSEAYLERLFEISQRLEKTQNLTEQEVSHLLLAIHSSDWQ